MDCLLEATNLRIPPSFYDGVGIERTFAAIDLSDRMNNSFIKREGVGDFWNPTVLCYQRSLRG